MNERIKKLARKSGLLGRKFAFGQYWEDNLTDEQKKFAELIVKECVNICNTTTDRGYLNGVVAGHKIKEHFGVEE